MRYVNLSTVLVYRLVSRKVMNRFPDFDSLVEARLLLLHEVEWLKRTKEKSSNESTWVPILWALKLISNARNERKINLEPAIFADLQNAFDEIERFLIQIKN